MTQQNRSEVKILIRIAVFAVFVAIMVFLFIFLKADLFPKEDIPSSGSRSIGIQALAATLTTIGTFILLLVNFRSEQRAKNAEEAVSRTIRQTDRMIEETSRLAESSQYQAEALSSQSLQLQETNNSRYRYSLLPLISKDSQGSLNSVHLINTSASPIVIVDIRKDDKDYISKLDTLQDFGGASYIILEPSKTLILLKKDETSGMNGDSYQFNIGLYYGRSGAQIQKMSFKIVLGMSGTAIIEDYIDTNPSRPSELIENNSDGSFKRIVDKTQ